MNQLFKNTKIHELPIIELTGSFQKMGASHGEEFQNEIHELYEIRLQQAIKTASENQRVFSFKQAKELARNCLKYCQEFDFNVYQEFAGIAQGAKLSEEELYIMQGMTDFRDYLSFGKLPDGYGCSSILVPAELTQKKNSILAQNWDLQTTNMPYVCLIHRKPLNAPETWSLTVVGGLSLIGMNSHGIAVGNTNITTTDSRTGVQYLMVLHAALNCSNFAEAAKKIATSHRAGAHYYYLGSENNELTAIECTATKNEIFTPQKNTFIHCNHILSDRLKFLESQPASESSTTRQQRIEKLLNNSKNISEQKLKDILSDHEHNEMAICRHDVNNGVSTNASIIMIPAERKFSACRSQPHKGKWLTKNL